MRIPAKRRSRSDIIVEFVVLFSLVLVLGLEGCWRIISVPPDAPVMLSTDTVTSSPFVRQQGQWVRVSGKVTLHAGEVVVVLPATQP